MDKVCRIRLCRTKIAHTKHYCDFHWSVLPRKTQREIAENHNKPGIGLVLSIADGKIPGAK